MNLLNEQLEKAQGNLAKLQAPKEAADLKIAGLESLKIGLVWQEALTKGIRAADVETKTLFKTWESAALASQQLNRTMVMGWIDADDKVRATTKSIADLKETIAELEFRGLEGTLEFAEAARSRFATAQIAAQEAFGRIDTGANQEQNLAFLKAYEEALQRLLVIKQIIKTLDDDAAILATANAVALLGFNYAAVLVHVKALIEAEKERKRLLQDHDDILMRQNANLGDQMRLALHIASITDRSKPGPWVPPGMIAVRGGSMSPEAVAAEQANIVPAAHGFHGDVNKPTLFLAGEAGNERVDIGKSGGRGVTIVNNFASGSVRSQDDIRQIEQAQARAIRRANQMGTEGSTTG